MVKRNEKKLDDINAEKLRKMLADLTADELRELRIKVSKRLGFSSVVFLCYSEEFIEVAWCGDVISIYDNGYGVGKGHVRYEVYMNGRRERGTGFVVCLTLIGGKIQLRGIWSKFKKLGRNLDLHSDAFENP